VIAGGNGFLGRSLQRALLKRGYEVSVLVRKPTDFHSSVKVRLWDGKNLGDWTQELDGAVALVNLVGRSVNCRYNESNRREIIDSRIDSVGVLGDAVRQCRQPPMSWIQSGSLAIYGEPGERICDEASPEGTGFSVEVCRAWERSFDHQQLTDTRKVLFRIGIVLGEGGGIMRPFMGLVRWGLGGTVGSGRQFISWIHESDMNSIFIAAIEQQTFSGMYNATAPNPARNREFMSELRKAFDRPWSPPVPEWLVRFGARWILRTEAMLALGGRGCVPTRLLAEGFQFRVTSLGEALSRCAVRTENKDGVFGRPDLDC
jgi:uncharacterized protein (TIGR01777 family)